MKNFLDLLSFLTRKDKLPKPIIADRDLRSEVSARLDQAVRDKIDEMDRRLGPVPEPTKGQIIGKM